MNIKNIRKMCQIKRMMIMPKKINNDEIKNEYCYQNNIKLIRIPYWNKDEIPIILNELKNEYQAAQKGVTQQTVSTENVSHETNSDDINNSNKEAQDGET